MQHTFNVAGLAFKRNIDQHYPSGHQPIGLSDERLANPSLRDRCMRRSVGLDGRPDDYRTWRDKVAPVGLDADYWTQFQAGLEGCDNLEGFTFAQEIGISEHFEMNGSLRADVSASVEAVETPEMVQPDARVSRNSSDYFYNFGSVDALWNGAWVWCGFTAMTRCPIRPRWRRIMPKTSMPI